MAAAPVDYAALAKQAGAVQSTPPPPQGKVDYTALAKQAGAVQSSPAAPPAAPAAPAHWYDAAVHELGDLNTGFTSALSQTGGTAERGLTHLPVVGDMLKNSPGYQKSMADDAARASAPMNTPGKIAGNAIENILEFASGDEALKSLSLAEKVKTLGNIASTIEKYPAIAKIIGVGAHQAAVGTAQGLAHGESAGDALMGGAITGATGGAIEGAGQGFNKLSSIVDAIRPTSDTIEGVKIPKLASQPSPDVNPDLSKMSLEDIATSNPVNRVSSAAAEATGIGEAPGYQAAQQEGAKRSTANMAQRSLKDSLARVDAAAPVAAPVEGAPASSAPSTVFHLGDGTPELPTTTDPNEARTALSNLEDVIEGKGFDQLTPGRQQAMQGTADGLRRQLADYAGPTDHAAAAGQVANFRQAADVLESRVQPTYGKLDELSDGTFSALRNTEKVALKTMRNPANVADYEAAESRLGDTRDKMAQIFYDHQDKIAPAEYRAAQGAWREAGTYRDIHTALESSFNGVSQEMSDATGIQRTMKGGTPAFKRLQRLLDKRGSDIQSTIGQKGSENLYKIADLLKTPQSAQDADGMARGTSTALRIHHKTMGGLVGGAIGGTVGGFHGAAIGTGVGATTQAASEFAYRKAIHAIATDPKVADRFAFAVKNRVSSRIAAPLIASMMLKSQASQQAPQQQQETGEPQQ